MFRVPLMVVISLVAGVTAAEAAEPIVGWASVTDGDTLVIHGGRIRLYGIDAPESAQMCEDGSGKDYRCGQAAALALADRIGEAPILCDPRDTDPYGRTVAVCKRGTEDLNAWMVAQGHAVAFRRYSSDYAGQEAQARAAKRGIWAGTFEDPAGWRRISRGGAAARIADEPTPAGSKASMTCTIKGNISAKGDRIYQVIDERAGERMFCTEDEAKAAGWRASSG
jgi:endonuclease YncB( thermonuclease family)